MNQTFDFYNSRFVNGERVVQAREMACMTQVELARLVSVTQPMIAHLEKGLKQPSMDLAEAIARETKVSIDFLCQPSGVALPEGSMFRAKTAVSAQKLLQAHSMAERAFEMFLKLSTHFNLPSSRLRPVEGQPEQAAASARKMLGLSANKPIPHLIRAFEKAGGIVIPFPELEGREAFAVWAGERPVVGIGPTPSGDRLRFSVAHEIGHLLMHQSPTAKAKAEVDANAFAAELHMPAEAICSDLEQPLSVARLGQLKLKWGVSMASLLFRARELGLVSRRAHDRLIVEMAPYKVREPSAYSIPLEKPRVLRQMVDSLYGEQTDSKALADQFCLPEAFVRDVLNRYASSAEVAPARSSKVVNIGSRLMPRPVKVS
jgi:Zn-dependent peptidase ImmA (M78 family)/transcriptional regulator with XRE-family HTH domain